MRAMLYARDPDTATNANAKGWIFGAEYGGRTFDPRRAERLPWCGLTISNSKDPFVTVWDYMEGGGRIRTYIWLETLDYVVILEKRRQRIGTIAFLVTAYHVLEERSKTLSLERYRFHRFRRDSWTCGCALDGSVLGMERDWSSQWNSVT